MNWDKILSCQNPCNSCKKEWDCITKPENHYDCWEEKEWDCITKPENHYDCWEEKEEGRSE